MEVQLVSAADHDRAHLLASLVMLHPDHHALHHLVEFPDHGLDFERRDIGPRGLDELGATPDIEQPRIAGAAIDPVSGVVPPVGVEGLPPLFLVVSGHHADAANQQFPDHTVGDRGTPVVDDRDVGVGEATCCLGHGAVHRISVGHIGHRDVEWPVAQHGRRRQITAGEAGMLPHPLGERRPTHDAGGPLGLSEIEGDARIESWHQQQRHRVVHRTHDGQHPTDPEQRHGTDDHRFLLRPGDGPDRGRPRRGLSHQGSVGVQHALRVRGRSRRVHHDGQIGGGHLGLGRGQHVSADPVVGVVGAPGRPGDAGAGSERDAPQKRCDRQRQPVRPLIGEAGECRLHTRGDVDVQHPGRRHEQPDVGQPDHLGQLGGPVHGAQRDRDRADARCRQPPDDPLDAVGEEQPHPGPLTDADSQHPPGQFCRTLFGLTVGQSTGRGDRIDPVTMVGDGAGEQSRNGQRCIGHGSDHLR